MCCKNARTEKKKRQATEKKTNNFHLKTAFTETFRSKMVFGLELCRFEKPAYFFFLFLFCFLHAATVVVAIVKAHFMNNLVGLPYDYVCNVK